MLGLGPSPRRRALLVALVLGAAAPASAMTFTVTSAADSGPGTLRDTLNTALGTPSPPHVIQFNIAPSGPHTIALLSALPTIGVGAITLDATTQPGYSGTPIIELDGTMAGAADGVHVVGSNDVVKGFVINRFGGAGIYCGNGSGTVIQGNYIGTNMAGTAALPNGGNGVDMDASSAIVVGGTGANQGNLISGNAQNGVELASTSGSTIQGNTIGTNAAGTAAIPNALSGIASGSFTVNVTIGGTTAAARNVISGNTQNGIIFPTALGVSGNKVQGNYIGTNAAGTAALGNGQAGVWVQGVPGTTVGGTAAGAGNVISGNAYGVRITGAGTSGTLVQGNRIGTDAAGTGAVPNTSAGLWLESASSLTLGGTAAGAGNVISGNGTGILLDVASQSNVVQGNLIGTNVSATAPVPNTGDGIQVQGPSNTIGGTAAGAGNVLAGNGADGVEILAAAQTVQGNFIGTNAAGSPLPNALAGVFENGVANVVLGGTAAGAANVIAFNQGPGVAIAGASSNGDSVVGNSIYANGGLGIDLGNDGVTGNDPCDADTGPNGLQNFPVISSATNAAGTTSISGSLNSTASTANILLHFYASPTLDPSGNGEGKTYLGTTMVTTDASCLVASWNAMLTTGPIPGQYITATSTRPTNDTSEFSVAKQVCETPDVTGPNVTPPAPVTVVQTVCL